MTRRVLVIHLLQYRQTQCSGDGLQERGLAMTVGDVILVMIMPIRVFILFRNKPRAFQKINRFGFKECVVLQFIYEVIK